MSLYYDIFNPKKSTAEQCRVKVGSASIIPSIRLVINPKQDHFRAVFIAYIKIAKVVAHVVT